MPAGIALPEDLSRQVIAAIEAAAGGPVFPRWYLDRPQAPQPIGQAERIQGLAAIWAEGRVSFPFWDDLPDLDWDGAFRTYLPLVAAAESPAEYYRLLRRFIALLGEGHSYVLPPVWLDEQVRPPVAVAPAAGRPVIIRGDALPCGTVITHVDGRPVGELLPERLELTSGGALHHRLAVAMAGLLEGRRDTVAEVTVVLPDGSVSTAALKRTGALPAPPLLERVDLGAGRVLVRIANWHEEGVVERFHVAFPDFDGIRALVIDMRRNGGGNSANGDAVLARLIDGPVERGVSYSPMYWGRMAAWGMGRPVLAERECPLRPDSERPRYAGPVAVLTGPFTFSAAEDFCASFRLTGRGPLVGETTGGSTGTPALFPLPGGGAGAVSATRCEYPGVDFIRRGIAPDVPAAPTVAGLAAGRDEVLEAALSVLNG